MWGVERVNLSGHTDFMETVNTIVEAKMLATSFACQKLTWLYGDSANQYDRSEKDSSGYTWSVYKLEMPNQTRLHAIATTAALFDKSYSRMAELYR